MRQSELVEFCKCERSWFYTYQEKIEVPPTAPMAKGTLWHAFLEEWWSVDDGLAGVSWDRVLERVPQDTLRIIVNSEEIRSDVQWMAERYDRWREGSRQAAPYAIVAQEVEVWDQGRIDFVAKYPGEDGLWVGERKSMRDWRRLDFLTVDPQLTQYLKLARAFYHPTPVHGIIYEAAKTYRWKTGNHSPDESFREMTVLRTDKQLAQHDDVVCTVMNRMDDITWVGDTIPNIGMFTCSGCKHKERCWSEMAVPDGGIQVEE